MIILKSNRNISRQFSNILHVKEKKTFNALDLILWWNFNNFTMTHCYIHVVIRLWLTFQIQNVWITGRIFTSHFFSFQIFTLLFFFVENLKIFLQIFFSRENLNFIFFHLQILSWLFSFNIEFLFSLSFFLPFSFLLSIPHALFPIYHLREIFIWKENDNFSYFFLLKKSFSRKGKSIRMNSE